MEHRPTRAGAAGLGTPVRLPGYTASAWKQFLGSDGVEIG